MGLANPKVLIDSKSMLSLPVGLENPMVLINGKFKLSLPVVFANPMVLIDGKFIFDLLMGLAIPKVLIYRKLFIDRRFIVEIIVGLANPKVFIDIVYGKEKSPAGLVNHKGFPHRNIMPKLSCLMELRIPRIYYDHTYIKVDKRRKAMFYHWASGSLLMPLVTLISYVSYRDVMILRSVKIYIPPVNTWFKLEKKN